MSMICISCIDKYAKSIDKIANSPPALPLPSNCRFTGAPQLASSKVPKENLCV